ncbi:phosphotransferase family protein [Candidatus Poribacteria bacterium]|nr:phosphotransferase family protein [Candidatus Poribacteria bacterium]
MPHKENEIQSGLLSFYERKFPSRKNAQVYSLTQITDGWENEVYSFTIEYEETTERKCEELILRIYPGSDAPQKSVREFNAMKKLHEVGFPVPEVFLLELDNSPFGKPFVIMEKINGRPMGAVFDEAPDKKKEELITLFCKMFVDLHTLNWRFFVPDTSIYATGNAYMFINRWLSQAQKYLEYFQANDFAPVLDWLKARSLDVPCERLSVTHGDYHPYNILLRNDGAAFVIDWGNVEVADFRSDLAWTLLLTSTYGNPEAREIILSEYEQIAGCKIEQIEYFEVMAILRRLFSISMSLSDGASKLGMRPGAETMMRRNVGHLKNVYALLIERTGITIPKIETLIEILVHVGENL